MGGARHREGAGRATRGCTLKRSDAQDSRERRRALPGGAPRGGDRDPLRVPFLEDETVGESWRWTAPGETRFPVGNDEDEADARNPMTSLAGRIQHSGEQRTSREAARLDGDVVSAPRIV